MGREEQEDKRGTRRKIKRRKERGEKERAKRA